MKTKRIPCRGGVLIPPSGGVALQDFFTGDNLSLDLVDQSDYETEATLYIPMKGAGKAFDLTQVRVGYVDATGTDDLANVILLEGPQAADHLQQSKHIWNKASIGETPTTGPPDVTNLLNSPIHVILDEANKVYFMTDWTTAVINCNLATEFFYIILLGHVEAYY